MYKIVIAILLSFLIACTTVAPAAKDDGKKKPTKAEICSSPQDDSNKDIMKLLCN